MGSDSEKVCVKIQVDASLTVEEAEAAIDEIMTDVHEMGEAVSYAIDYNNVNILEQKTPADMAAFYKFGDAICSEENHAQSCMYFTDGGNLGLPIGAWTQIRPKSVNLSGPDVDFRVRLSPPSPYRAGNIDLETVRLHTELGSVRFNTDNEAQISTNHEGRVYAQILFPAADVEGILAVSDSYDVYCDFKIRETSFSGSDYISVVNSRVLDSYTRKKLVPQKTLARGPDISFFVGDDGAEVVLEIFDVKGRLVRTLIESPLPSGRHTYTWDGNDDNGLRVPSGLYFSRVRAGETETSSKVFIIR
jgi:hypothetical protein